LSQVIPSAGHCWIDDLNPWAFRLFENFGIRWWGVAYVVGIAFAGDMFFRWAQQKCLPISLDEAHTLCSTPPSRLLSAEELGIASSMTSSPPQKLLCSEGGSEWDSESKLLRLFLNAMNLVLFLLFFRSYIRTIPERLMSPVEPS
jgi:hypothetical protein